MYVLAEGIAEHEGIATGRQAPVYDEMSQLKEQRPVYHPKGTILRVASFPSSTAFYIVERCAVKRAQ